MSHYTVSNTFPSSSLRAALAVSVVDGSFADTAYQLFSKRLANGKVGAPQTIYASSTVLKASGEHFRAQSDGGFSTHESIPEDTAAYGYESDSDIDDSEYLEKGVLTSFDEAEAKESDQAEETRTIVQKENMKAKEEGPNNTGVETTLTMVQSVKYTVVIPDVAAETWRALVYYIYTGSVCFAPLRSEGINKRQKLVAQHRENKSGPPLCSPKSMYRLADIDLQVGLPSLKSLAENDIKSKLSAVAIVEEVFSRFSSIYSEILDMQLQFLYTNAIMSQVMTEIQHKVRVAVQGQIPHAENVLGTLLLKLSSLLVEQWMQASVSVARSTQGPVVLSKDDGEYTLLRESEDDWAVGGKRRHSRGYLGRNGPTV
ncbi:hypothetical protein EW026_g7032 [Hermanssonia centrifuga]|uniref:Uncharacterized protein n=1 Tax=Hermanssonia centrifuga TaxID=98765 RepID=A0A4S4K9B1_9APHY|nr:hypothetical protein EW026_g7032 [Hermanssonia centrifuga]